MIKILLVDDEPSFLDLSKTFLELNNPNTEIDLADSAEKALFKILNNSYDVIISDYTMPGMDGLALLEKIRDMEIKIPFIMFSGKGKKEVLREAFDSDMAFYFQKQDNPELQFFQLSQKIRQVLEEWRADELLHISHLALDNSREAVCWLDINSRIIHANSAACELLGFSGAELSDRSLKDLDREFKLEHWHYYWKELRREKHLSMECFIRRGDGREIPLEINSNLVEYGCREYNCAFLRDSTEQKIKEKELNLAKFSLNNAPDAIFWITKSGELIYVNDSACEMLGYSKKELLDLHFRDIDPAAGEEGWKGLWEAARKEKCCTFESVYSGRAGKSVPVESNLNHLSYANKEYVCVFSRDISKRLQADSELRASEERMNLAIRGARIGAWDLNVPTDEFVVSEDWLKILGHSSDEFENSFEFYKQVALHPDELEDIKRKLREHLEGKTSLYRSEHRLLRGDGEYVWILSYGEVVARDNKGNPLRMSGIHLDITEMRENREALRQTNEKLNLLSSINRHDIQNQISIAAGYLGLIKGLAVEGGIQFSSSQADSLSSRADSLSSRADSLSSRADSLSSQADSFSSSVESYLSKAITAVSNIQRQISFTRDYQDMGVRSAEWQNVGAVVKRAADPLLQESLTLEVATEGLQVYADPMLEKVFYNLIDNSKRHGVKVKKIRVSCRETGGVCILSYEDDGVGIAAELKEKIFEKEFGRNTGYGLFLIKEILDITGISIMETGVEGCGACFEIEIPDRNYRLLPGASPSYPGSGVRNKHRLRPLSDSPLPDSPLPDSPLPGRSFSD